jgi:hypothetical protein
LSVSDLGEELVERVVRSCRAKERWVEGILVYGSYATGRARPESDLDLDLFIADEPTVHYRTWFEPRDGPNPLHVSARCDLSIDVWEEEQQEPEHWALGLPVELQLVWLWCGNERLAEALGKCPVLAKPGSPPEIEDMIDAVLKMRRRARAKDELGARLEAQAAARYASRTIAALNAPAPVADPRSALESILALPVAPPGWASQFVVAIGLSSASLDEVLDATDRLVAGTLQVAHEVNPGVDRQPEIERYLRDGTLERMLE